MEETVVQQPPVQSLPTLPQAPKTEFIPHKLDPLLSYREGGRLIGRSHTCISNWVQSGLLEPVRPSGATHPRIRRSDLIRVSGVAAFVRQSPFLWELEDQLPPDYDYKEEWPKPREHDSLRYWPVPLEYYQSQIENA